MKHRIFDINPLGRDFFVGDIHGMLDLFMYNLRKVDFDFEQDRMFGVGDLIDRGPNNRGCLDLLNQPWFHAVRGNHEDMLLANTGGLARGDIPWHVWMRNGGEWFNDLTELQKDHYRDLVGAVMYDKMTVKTLYGNIGVAHADVFGKWNNDVFETDFTGEAALLWGRRRVHGNIHDRVEGIDAVVVGHTPMKHTKVLGNVVMIDTGAVYDEGYLTVLEADEVLALIGEQV
jgi:serine/threonine protein phosphatase 1